MLTFLGECIKWRQTGECDTRGEREPQNDKACSAKILDGWSGYCECSNGIKIMEKGCHRDRWSNCKDACKEKTSA